jgi:flagellar motor switch protein FliN/FliY
MSEPEHEPRVEAQLEQSMSMTRDARTTVPETDASEASSATAGDASNFEAILQIPVSVKVVLGSATISIANLAKLGRGAVIALNKKVGEPVDVTVNGRLVARGEVVVLEDDNSRFGVSLTEVIGLPFAMSGKSTDSI